MAVPSSSTPNSNTSTLATLQAILQKKTPNPELQKAKERWYPDINYAYTDEFQGTHYHVSDVMASPLKHATANAGLITLAVTAIGWLALGVSHKKLIPPREELEKFGTALLAFATLGFAWDYVGQSWSNQRAEKISQILGGNPTFADWKRYRQQHPSA